MIFQKSKKKCKKLFKEGKLHGYTQVWHESGKRATSGHYQNGRRKGKHTDYYSNGKIKNQTVYQKDGSRKATWKNGEKTSPSE